MSAFAAMSTSSASAKTSTANKSSSSSSRTVGKKRGRTSEHSGSTRRGPSLSSSQRSKRQEDDDEEDEDYSDAEGDDDEEEDDSLQTAVRTAAASLKPAVQKEPAKQRPPTPKQKLDAALIENQKLRDRVAELDKAYEVSKARIEGLNRNLEQVSHTCLLAQNQLKQLQTEYLAANRASAARADKVIDGAGTLTAQAVHGVIKTAHAAVQGIRERASRRDPNMKMLLGPAESFADPEKRVSDADVQKSIMSTLNETVKDPESAKKRLEVLDAEIVLQRDLVSDTKLLMDKKEPNADQVHIVEHRKLTMLLYQQRLLREALAKFPPAAVFTSSSSSSVPLPPPPSPQLAPQRTTV